MSCKYCSTKLQKICAFGFGIGILAFGVFFIVWLPSFTDEMLYKSLPLTPTSRTRDKWEVLPIPVYLHMYLFNWTNSAEIHNPNVKPNFEQMGPYVFLENKTKEDIKWHQNGTVTFSVRRTWYFEPEKSNGTLDDNITCPHLPSIAASNVIRNSPWLVKKGFNSALNRNGGSLNTTHTAIEWLFDGFFDQFLNFSMGLNVSAGGATIDTNQFAWFLGRNGSKDFEGFYTIHTGQGDLTRMGELTHWNGNNHTGFYQGECGKINGSTGDLWQPRRDPDKSISMFVPDTCRFINLFPKHDETVEGIPGIRYEANQETFDSGEIYPNMKCFCPSKREGNCPKTGVIDLSPCARGAPMYMSHSNFMYADQSFASTITGMNPDPEKHSFYVTLEQSLGIPLAVKADIQVNLFVQNDKDIDILKKIPDFYAPLFVISNQARMDEKLAKEVKFALKLPTYGLYIGIGVTTVGALILVVAIVLTTTHNRKGKKGT